MKKTLPNESLLVFPCDFTIKIFGLASDNIEIAVGHIIQQHVPHFDSHAIQSRHSQEGKYLALSVTLPVNSQEQLDRLYQDLSSSPQVLMVL